MRERLYRKTLPARVSEVSGRPEVPHILRDGVRSVYTTTLYDELDRREIAEQSGVRLPDRGIQFFVCNNRKLPKP